MCKKGSRNLVNYCLNVGHGSGHEKMMTSPNVLYASVWWLCVVSMARGAFWLINSNYRSNLLLQWWGLNIPQRAAHSSWSKGVSAKLYRAACIKAFNYMFPEKQNVAFAMYVIRLTCVQLTPDMKENKMLSWRASDVRNITTWGRRVVQENISRNKSN